MNLTAHIMGLAHGHNIIVVKTEGLTGSARAYTGHRIISIRPTNDERQYLVALHEIGHIVLRHHSRKGIIAKELEAWKWAIAHKRCPLTQAGVDEIHRCLNSYLREEHAYEARSWLAHLKPDGQTKMSGPKGMLP